MKEDLLSIAERLSDQDLLVRTKLLAHRERQVTVALLAHLAVLDERRLYLGEGCASLFTYCTQILHLSEHAAYNRIEAARAARRFPIILERLKEGSITLATVRLLAPHLTPANHEELLTSSHHKSKREVEELVARIHPLPLVPSLIRRLPARGNDSRTAVESGIALTADSNASEPPHAAGHTAQIANLRAAAPPHAQSQIAHSRRRAIVEPLGPREFRVQFTAGTATRDKLRLAQELLSHQIPDGNLAEIIDRALTLLLEALAREKLAATDQPNVRAEGERGTATSLSRRIPAAVKRAVWIHDAGRCAFVSPMGHRCAERRFLEFHHVKPYAVGGTTTIGNIELRCRAHNRYEAELYFGGGVSLASGRSAADLARESPDGATSTPVAHLAGDRRSAAGGDDSGGAPVISVGRS